MGIHDSPYNVRIQDNVGGRGRIKRREFACAFGEMTPLSRARLQGRSMHFTRGAKLSCVFWSGLRVT